MNPKPALGAAHAALISAGTRSARLLALGVLMIGLGACTPKLDQAKADFCADLNSYASAVNKLNALDVNSTLDQFVAARDAVNFAFEKLTRSAEILKVVEYKSLQASNQAFDKAVRSITDKDTLAQADAAIGAAAATAIDQYLQIANTICTYGPATQSK